MEMAGYAGGAVRAPLQRPGSEAVTEINKLLHDAIGVLEATVAD
jgi:hypothetical protein